MKRPIDAVIEEVITDTSRIQPIIVNFQNGELKDDEAKKMSCGIFHDKQNKAVLALSNEQVVYKGYRPNVKKELMRTMLVLHNRRTGKVRLIEAERWEVSPVLQKPDVEDSKTVADDKIAMLNKQFGSKRVKRRTEQYERMKVNVDSIKDQLEQTVSNVEIDRVDLALQLTNNNLIANTNLPECNKDATNVKDVYNVYDIIPKSKLETLYDKAMDLLNNGAEGKSRFFTQVIANLKSDPDRVQKTAILIYIDLIGAWLNMPMKDARKRGSEICPFSEEVNSHVINTYSVASAHGRLRPSSVKDKGVIHSLILSLIICHFTLDIELFSSIFTSRIGMKKFLDLARIIGALPNKDDKKIITLKVPLPPPPTAKKGKKK